MARVLILVATTLLVLVQSLKISDKTSCSSSSSSSSSEEHHGGSGGGKHHHHHHHGNGNGNGNGNSNDNRGCATGWRRFSRPSGGWCIKVFPGTNLAMSLATSLCQEQGAQLTGIQNSDEMTYIHQSAASSLSSNTGSLWIGARRSDACIGSKLTAACNKLNSFYWTDSSTTGTAGFSWLDGSQPDNANGGNQNCISFFYAPSNTTINRVNWYPGALDDVNCLNGVNGIPLREYRGYVCGKAATGN